MRKVWSASAVALLLLGLAGCQTPPRPYYRPPLPLTIVAVPEELVVVPALPIVFPSTVQPLPPPAVSNVVVTPPPSTPTNTLPPVVPPVPAPSLGHAEHGWIAWEKWCERNRLPPPERITATINAAHPTYEVQDQRGWFSIKIGSQLAYFNGLECWLGFAPRLLHGLPHIHSLDAEKIFDPLLTAPAPLTNGQRIIVIDPGHGGHDSGTKSTGGNAFEKQFTLDWAERLRGLLAQRGWQVYLTRTNDSNISLADRVALADRVSATLFLSLHYNSGYPNQDHHGIETYCLTPVGMPSNLIRDREDDLKKVFANNAYDARNLQYAVRLHRALVEATRAEDRGLRHARFMGVLRGQTRPAVLIEGGYLSNPDEARRIASPAYRQTMAEAVARALE